MRPLTIFLLILIAFCTGIDSNLYQIESVDGTDLINTRISIDVENINENFMLLDVGTNTEIILGNKDNLVAASCPAGPAFEGGEVTYAMPGYDGAIEKFSIEKGSQKYNTINKNNSHTDIE